MMNGRKVQLLLSHESYSFCESLRTSKHGHPNNSVIVGGAASGSALANKAPSQAVGWACTPSQLVSLFVLFCVARRARAHDR